MDADGRRYGLSQPVRSFLAGIIGVHLRPSAVPKVREFLKLFSDQALCNTAKHRGSLPSTPAAAAKR
jgi:hypothetical protein